MDEIVVRSLAKWPNVPAVYGWLDLDRRGNWLIKGERIGNRALREFIARNYAADESGCWFFQNGPQRVFVTLAYTPLVMHYEGESLLDHCGRPTQALETFLDDEGSVLIRGERAGEPVAGFAQFAVADRAPIEHHRGALGGTFGRFVESLRHRLERHFDAGRHPLLVMREPGLRQIGFDCAHPASCRRL